MTAGPVLAQQIGLDCLLLQNETIQPAAFALEFGQPGQGQNMHDGNGAKDENGKQSGKEARRRRRSPYSGRGTDAPGTAVAAVHGVPPSPAY